MSHPTDQARELFGLLVGAILVLTAVTAVGVVAFPRPFVDSAVCLGLMLAYGLLPRRVARAALMVGAYGAAYAALFVTLAVHLLRLAVDMID